MKNDLEIDSARLDRELQELARFSNAEPSGEGTAVTRVVFSEEDRHARSWLRQLADQAGLEIREDAVGNTFFRWPGSDASLAAVATGSHIDAIPHAGMYDGTVGVLGGLEAIRALQRSGLEPRRSIELVLFTSEEPTRFGIGCLGSRLMGGVLDPVRADSLTDGSGSTLREVRSSAGFSGDLASAQLGPAHYRAWVELHIEQGPLLERERLPIGVVEKIAAPAGYRFVLEGFGGHAGALLMPDRRDALCAAAEVILAVERGARATGAIDTVATVGLCDVFPGAVNSVPSRVALSLDIRDTDPARREAVMGGLREEIRRIAERRGVVIREELVNADQPALCAPEIIDAIEHSCAGIGIASKRMVSRAYHDSLFMAQIAPVAMIFIPCRNGVSHRPDEFASPDAIATGTRVLARTLARLASL
jgi:N-carbamoyl-L-amino-acid hydrolase